MTGDRARILGVEVARLRMPGVVERCIELIEAGVPATHVSLNAAKLVASRSDPDIRRALAEATIVGADGQAIVWASWLLGDPLPERVAGIDLMKELLAAAEVRGYPIFLLGARGEVLEDAVAQLRRERPSLIIAGYRDGYFGEDERAAVAESVRASGARIVFLAMSSPLKERWQVEHASSLRALVMGVGGAVDVLAGRSRRAPLWLQRAGLEWLFRVFQEPGRLGPRYASTNLRFLLLLGRELARRPRGAGRRSG